MKSKIKITGILFVLILFSIIFPKQVLAQGPYVSYQVFYDQLSPYGQWLDYPGYGYVWLPDAGPDFFPYSSRGSWIMTDYGWTWLSDYNWGWAPFHYGRWDYDNYYGWLWVPDNVWGPAWVTWRRAPGYYGWSPMGPGMNIDMSFGNNYNYPGNHWTFVNDRYFGRNNINRYYASQNDYDMLLRNSTVINNTYVDNSRRTTYVAGPTISEVRGATGRRIHPYSIQENNIPGQSLSNGQFRIYRPQVMKNTDNEQRPAPSSIANLQDVRRPSERNTQSQQGNINSYGNRRQEQQQNAVNRQNAEEQQDAVNQQRTVNRQNAADRQNAVKRQDDVNQQNKRNNDRVMQQQNVKRTNTERREPSVNTVNTTRNSRSDESRKKSQERK